MKIKPEEMIQKFSEFRRNIIPNLNITNLEKDKLLERADGIFGHIRDMLSFSPSDVGQGSEKDLFDFFLKRVTFYSTFRDELEKIKNNSLPKLNP